MDNKFITVSELNSYIKENIESDKLLWDVPVMGEIAEIRPSKGNLFFSLKDEFSQFSMICFRSNIKYIPKEGDFVLVSGKISYYLKTGKLSLIVNKIEPFGKGKIIENFEQLKEKLNKEGLFDAKRKKAPPLLPRRVAVVTSKDGAVIKDIYKTIRKSNSYIDVTIINVSVQGLSAVNDIKNALKIADNSNLFDVVILARGGGSAEDLSAFNDEFVVRTLASLKLFTISAIGHETDNTLCDAVADNRSLTPTAAGEFIVNICNQTIQNIYDALYSIDSTLTKRIDSYKNRVYKKIKDVSFFYEKYLISFKNRIKTANGALISRGAMKILSLESSMQTINATLKAVNPNRLFENGYFKIMKDNKNINSIKSLKKTDKIKIFGKEGTAYATIDDTLLKNKGE